MMWFVGMADRNPDNGSRRTSSSHYSQLEEANSSSESARNAVEQLNHRYNDDPNHRDQDNGDQEEEEESKF